MIPAQAAQEFLLGRLRSTTPQFRQDHGRTANKPGNGLDSVLMAPETQMIDQNRGIKDNQVTHGKLRTGAAPRFFSSAP